MGRGLTDAHQPLRRQAVFTLDYLVSDPLAWSITLSNLSVHVGKGFSTSTTWSARDGIGTVRDQ